MCGEPSECGVEPGVRCATRSRHLSAVSNGDLSRIRGITGQARKSTELARDGAAGAPSATYSTSVCSMYVVGTGYGTTQDWSGASHL